MMSGTLLAIALAATASVAPIDRAEMIRIADAFDQAQLTKDKKALETLKAHGWAPSAAPVLPQSEWKRL